MAETWSPAGLQRNRIEGITAIVAVLLALLAATGCSAVAAEGLGSVPEADRTGGVQGEAVSLRLQLQWSAQAQFAGYFVAQELGFYAAEGLDVAILEGAIDVVPQEVLAAGGAELAIAWVPKALVTREAGTPLVHVAQMFQRSGGRQVAWRDSGITEPAHWRGKRLGTWGFGNEHELIAAIRQAGLDPERDLTIVTQPADMALLLNRQIDAAQAMIYNEYALVLEATNPATGALYQPADLAVIDFNEIGTAMLEDALWVRQDWISDPANQEATHRFLRASFRGWTFCRDYFEACLGMVLRRAPTLGASHQRWQLNEVNQLMWPSPRGIGIVDGLLWEQTVGIATAQGVLRERPDPMAQRADLASAAVADLVAEGLDVVGANYRPRNVILAAGGR